MIKYLAAVVMYVLLSFSAYARIRNVKGIIRDINNKQTLTGVNIYVKGTTIGAYSDSTGAFSLNLPDSITTLNFSSIGFIDKTQAIGDSSFIHVYLINDSKYLNDVVVTAMGINRDKRELGYAVQKLDAKELVEGHQVNITDMLAAKIAGAQVTSSGGTPGSSSYIKIRGSNSLSAGNDPSNSGQPLFVIDGIPVNNSVYIFRGNRISDLQDVGFSNRGIDINPDDVESVEVLKGPAATALYGSRATGGVILLTTKKGSHGKMKIDYDGSYTLDKVNKLPELQQKFSQGSKGNYTPNDPNSWGASLSDLRYNSGGKIVLATDSAATSKKVTPFDNVSRFFQNGFTANNHVAISGGSKYNDYYVSIGNLTQQGIVPLSKFQRTSVRVGGATGTDKFKISTSILYTNSNATLFQQGSNESSIMVGLLRTPPSYDDANGAKDPVSSNTAYLNPNGTQRSYSAYYDNPYFSINQDPFRENVNRLTGNVAMNYYPLDWLDITYRVGTDLFNDKREQQFGIGSRRFPTGQVYDDEQAYREINSDFLVLLHHSFIKNLHSSLLLGDNFNQRKFSDLYVRGDGLTIPGFYNIANASGITAAQYKETVRLNGAFAQLKLDYKRVIYLDLTGRNDIASTFGPANNSFFYPSASSSFVFSDLLHLRNNKYLSFGSIRASYGQAGKEPGAYLTQTNYIPPVYGGGYINTIQFPFLGVNAFTLNNTGGNSNLKPEVQTSYELGTNLSFFANRLNVDFTWYNATGRDQIIPVVVSSASSFTSVIANAGSVENKGIELMVKGTPVKSRNFRWDVGLNFSRNRNKVLSAGNNVNVIDISSGFTSIQNKIIPGQPYGVLYGTRWLRNASGQVIIDDNPASVNYGYPKIDPVNGVIGNPNPDWIAGLQNQFTFKSVSLSFWIDVKKGGDMWNGTMGAINDLGIGKATENRTEQKIFDGVKASNGQKNDISATLDQQWYKGPGSGFNGAAEQYVQDASWIRLRTVTITWDIPGKWKNNLKITHAEIAAFGRNLLLLTPYKGIDPESNLKGADAGQGFEYFNMPGSKSYGISVKLSF